MSGELGCLLKALADHAATNGDKIALELLDRRLLRKEAVTYHSLWRRVMTVAAGISAITIPGDRVVLTPSHRLAYLIALLACFASGRTAVTAFEPNSRVRVDRFRAIIDDCKPALVVAGNNTETTARLREAIGKPVVRIVGEADLMAYDNVCHLSGPHDPAYLQYTSGSTGAPKGARVLHQNISANIRQIAASFALGADDSFGYWLPLYHDMGLVGVLAALWLGCPCYLITPENLALPTLWMELISRYRITVSGGPDFAYRYVANNVTREQVSSLDLTCWRVAFTGAEPVMAATMTAFADTFAAAGFDPAAFAPTYGLAEATLMVATSGVGSGWGIDRASGLVSCGPAAQNTEIMIVDPTTHRVVVEGGFGEIWVRGPQVVAGYHGSDPRSDAAFSGMLIGGSETKPYLRTGDCGALIGGALHVRGRLDNVILCRGQKHHAEDIERVVLESEIDSRSLGALAAVADPRAGGYALLAEFTHFDPNDATFAHRWPQTLMAAGAPLPKHILVCTRGSLPRTSSGKLMHTRARQLIDENALPVIRGYDIPEAITPEIAAPPSTLNDLLVLLLGRIVVEAPNDSMLTTLGVDSLRAAILAERLERTLGVAISARELLRTTIGELHRFAVASWPPPTRQHAAPATTLTPMQKSILAVHAIGGGDAESLVPLILECDPPMPLDRLRNAALTSLLCSGNHRFWLQMEGGTPRLTNIQVQDIPVRHVPTQLGMNGLAHFFDVVAEPIDILRGPCCDIVLATLDETNARAIAIRLHHIVGDLRSAELLLRYLARALDFDVPFADLDATISASSLSAARLRTWLNLKSPERITTHPYGHRGIRHQGSAPAKRATVHFSEDETAQFVQLAARGGVGLFDLALASFLGTLRLGTNGQAVGVGTIIAQTEPDLCFEDIGCRLSGVHLGLDFRLDATLLDAARALRVQVDAKARGIHETWETDLLFVWEGLAELHDSLVQLTMEPESHPIPIANGRLRLHPPRFTRTGFGLVGRAAVIQRKLVLTFDYQIDAWEVGAAPALLHRMRQLIQSFLKMPDEPLRRLALTGSPSAKKPAASAIARGPEGAVPNAIRRIAHTQPHALAFTSQDGSISYRSFVAEAAALAAMLPTDCLGKPVVFAGDGAFSFATASLAAWMRGGYPAPLDLGQPADRLRRIMTALRPAGFLCAASAGEAALSVAGGCAIIEMRSPSAVRKAPQPLPPHFDDKLTSPIGPAYVMTTSGTTADPRLVLGAHDALAAHCCTVATAFKLSLATRALCFSPATFDAILEEVYASLACGATVIDPGPHVRTNLTEFDTLLRTLAVEVVNIPTPFWRAWVTYLERRRLTPPPSLQLTVIGNAAIDPQSLARWEALCGARKSRLLDAYGPTEATATACLTDPTAYPPDPRDSRVMPRLGEPLAGRSIAVCDEAFAESQTGLSGEIVLGGCGLTYGYVSNPRLTAERFRPDPNSSVAGARLYHTGDLGCVLGGGEIGLCGRIDSQMKIRGFRVEPSEIEAICLAHADVADAAVFSIGTGDAAVPVALVEPRLGVTLNPEDLLSWLKERLPAPMRPAHVRIDSAPPRGHAGKIDRRRAADQFASLLGAVDPTVMTAFEQRLAEAWQEILSLSKQPGPTAHFFRQGGHSLAAMKLIAHYQHTFKLALDIGFIFGTPVLRDQAAALESMLMARLDGLSDQALRILADGRSNDAGE